MSTPHNQFGVLRAKARFGILIEGGALAAAALAGYFLITYGLDRNLRLEWPFRMAMLALFLGWLGTLLYRRVYRPIVVELSDDEMALAVERTAPQMKQGLISAVQFERVLLADGPTMESRDLMAVVVHDVQSQISTIPFHQALDRSRVQRFAALLMGAVLLVGGWTWLDPSNMKIWAMRNLGLSSFPWPRLTSLAFLGLETEGGRRHPEGDDLTLLVNASGVEIPEQVFLYYEFVGGDSGSEPMTMVGDAEFTITLPTILEHVTIWAESDDGLSERLEITVIERPRIVDLQVDLFFPGYMGREPELLEGAEADIKVPRGGGVQLRGRSTKPLDEAFTVFDQDLRQEMQIDSDRHSFSTRVAPQDTGLLVLDVLDEDRLGSAKPTRLFLRVTEDQPPEVDNRVIGIGSLITPTARIPGIIRVRDDYGLTALEPTFRIATEEQDDPTADEGPFVRAEIAFPDELQPGVVDHETTWLLDLLPLNPDADPESENNQVRPGNRVSVRFKVDDNYGPGEPHVSYSETLTFRVVTRQKLLEDLARRQMEERRELTRVRDEERGSRNELDEIVSPSADDERAVRARIRIQTLARDQKALGDRVRGVAERYQRVLDEMLNNRIFEPADMREIAAKIVRPLIDMSREDFPETSSLAEDFAASGQEDVRSSLVDGYDSILKRIDVVLLNMRDVENLAAILESLREVITDEENVMSEVRRQQEAQIERLLNPGRKKKDGEQTDKKNKDR